MIDLPGNPNRVYHLKQEVAQTSLTGTGRAVEAYSGNREGAEVG